MIKDFLLQFSETSLFRLSMGLLKSLGRSFGCIRTSVVSLSPSRKQDVNKPLRLSCIMLRIEVACRKSLPPLTLRSGNEERLDQKYEYVPHLYSRNTSRLTRDLRFRRLGMSCILHL